MEPPPQRTLQPLLHDLVVILDAPALAVCGTDGQVRAAGAQGIFLGDRRVVSRLEVTVDGYQPEPVLADVCDVGRARFVGILRRLGERIADPTVRLERRRRVAESATTEELELVNGARDPVECELQVRVAGDFADLRDVKSGTVEATTSEVSLHHQRVQLRAADLAVTITSRPAPGQVRADGDAGVQLSWSLTVPPGESATVALEIAASEPAGAGFIVTGAAGAPPWQRPIVRCDDGRLVSLVERSLIDLEGLLLADPDAPTDRYLGAGAPWFLTLFGRDSLWASRMLLPLGTELASGTLRTLARRQGTGVDHETAEQPGKILHEVRRAPHEGDSAKDLPPLYYGAIDATPLWVTLLHDAWRWGMPDDEVAALLPAAEAALGWMRAYGDSDGDGFLEYVNESGRGLANQGWKDSHDSVQFADGTVAAAPIALCEVQGYAYEAAICGAALLDAFSRPGGDAWRSWAARLRDLFRTAFWVEDDDGPYPAVALDGAKRPVDAVASNMGHLLGTGLLDAGECALVAGRLGSAALDAGFGLRTMAADSPRFNPLGYHTGSVWPHDTAVAVAGLAKTGHTDVAVRLARGLIQAAPAFGYRLPELYGGERDGSAVVPLAYPAACRPQAWAASAAIALLTAVLGIDPDVPAGRLVIRPLSPFPFRLLDVAGFQVGGEGIHVRIIDGKTEIVTAPSVLTVQS